MKVLAPLVLLAVAVLANPVDNSPAHQLVQRDCGAEDSCRGIGGGDVCNDRCKRCEGETGPYARGECCGVGWQTCCCYYE